MKRKLSLWTLGLAGTLLAGCQQTRVASTRYTTTASSAPTQSRLRIKTETMPQAAVPSAAATYAPEAAPVPAVTHGFVTEAPDVAPQGATPSNSRPGDAVEAPTTLPANLPPATAPGAVPAGPALPPPPVPSSRVSPGSSKQHVDPNSPETIVVMSQSDSAANQSLMLVENRTVPAPAAVVKTGLAAPKEGVCTITGEAQQFRRTWRLRYAPLDSDDAHGGSVNLSGEGLDRIREGQQIRVVGTMEAATERGDAPRFHVQFLEVLSR